MGKKLVIRVIVLLLFSKGAVSQIVNLDFKEAALQTVLAEVERQTGVRFIYSSEALKHARPVTVRMKQMNLTHFLKTCFEDQPLSYTEDGNYILIRIKKKVADQHLSPTPRYRSGQLVDQEGTPVPGATLSFLGTGRQITTNQEGEFVLSLSDEDTILTITSIEIDPVKIALLPIDTQMQIKAHRRVGSLDESVVKGYYTTSKHATTGSVTTIRMENIEKQAGAPLLYSLQGRSAGVYINTISGLPGGRLSVLIRGRSSIHGGTDPLVLLDGVPINPHGKVNNGTALPTELNQAGWLSGINPDAIQSIQFLKDADATAIYGARGGNGVILITTKKPEVLKQELEIGSKIVYAHVGHTSKMLSLGEYLEYRKEAFRNDGRLPDSVSAPDLLIWDQHKGNDWKRILLGKSALASSWNGRYSYRRSRLAATFSFNHQKQEAVHPGSRGYENHSFNLGANYRSSRGKFVIDYRGWYNSETNQPLSEDWITVLSLPPNFPRHELGNSLTWNYVRTNNHPISLQDVGQTYKTRFQQQQVIVKTSPAEWITGKIMVGMNSQKQIHIRYQSPAPANPGLFYKRQPENSELFEQVILVEPQIDLTRRFGSWQFNTSLGATWQESVRRISMYIPEVLKSEKQVVSKFAALFGRINWAYRSALQLNMVLRRDGSSRLGVRNQFGNFGALGTAWIFTESMPFRSFRKAMALGKIRASFGITGNDQLGDFIYLETFSAGHGYQQYPGWRPDRFANPNIGWERIRKSEIALDLVGIKDRFEMTVAYYNNISSHQLMEKPVPFIAGPFGVYLTNVPARLLNSGFELELAFRILNNQRWNWKMYGNISFPKNKLLEYPSTGTGDNDLSPILTGEDLNTRLGYRLLRIESLTGLPVFLDRNQDGEMNSADLVKIGTTSPRYFGGFGSDLRYKNLSMHIHFNYVAKSEIGSSPAPGTMVNLFRDAGDRWQKPGDQAGIPRASSLRNADLIAYAYSDAAMVNASFIRLRQISVAYDKSAGKGLFLKTKQIRWAIDAQNLFTWHRAASLLDPETLNTGYPPLSSLQLSCRIVI